MQSDQATMGGDRRSATLLVLIIATMFSVLLVRLFMVQLRPAAKLEERGERQRFRAEERVGTALPEVPVRAEVRDREGRLLASTWFDFDLVVDAVELLRGAKTPAEQGTRCTDLAGRVADTLKGSRKNLTERALLMTLSKGALKKQPSRWLPLVRGLNPTEQRQLETALKGVKGVRFEHHERRSFPYGAVTAQVVGLVGEHPKDRPGRVAGRTGVEFQLDRLLSGTAGALPVEKDAAGREFLPRWVEEATPVPGGHVELTLDAEIQRICMDVLSHSVPAAKAEKGSAVVLSARTGEVLAACTWPSADPLTIGPKDSTKLNLGAFLDLYEPGSTIKPVFVSWALQQGLVKMDTRFDCGGADGVHNFGPRLVREYHANPAPLTVREILIKSSNVGSVRIGYEKLGLDGELAALKAFHMSGRIKLGFPSMPNNRHTEKARAHALYTPTSFPQGYEMMMSPLMMARAFLVFARGGEYIEPSLVRAIHPQGERVVTDLDDTSRHVRVIDREVALAVRSALEEVMESGTGKSARSAKYAIAAKTGTPKIGQSELYNPLICTVAPVGPQEPEIVVVVLHHHVKNRGPGTYTGGTVSGPPARDIIERTLDYMRIPADAGRSAKAAKP